MSDRPEDATCGGHVTVPSDGDGGVGSARLTGRETTVREIAAWDEKGHTPEEIADAHGCTLADVYAALAFFHDHRDTVRGDDAWDQMKSDIPSKYREKYLRRLAARRTLLLEEVERYVEIVREHYEREQIILFGSLATGSVWSRSDVDLVIVMETELPFSERIAAMKEVLQPVVDVWVLVYTPAEFNGHVAARNWVYTDIARKGKVIYEKQSEAGSRSIDE